MKKLESLPAFKRVDLAEPPGGVTWTVPACPELAAFLATKPEGLVPDVGFETPEFPLLTAHRVSGTRHFYWLANNTTNDQTARLRFEGVTGGVTRWDCESGTTTALPASTTPAGTVCELTFPALAGFWVVIDTSAKPVAATPRAAKSPWTIDVAGPWNVRVDAAAQPVTEFPNVIPDDLKAGAAAVKPLGQWSTWGLTNFSGCLDYTTTFDAAAPSGQALLVDLGKVDEAAEVWLNGKSLGQRYWAPHRFAIPTSQLRQGRNELRIRVANSAGNVYGMKLPAGLTGPVTIRTE
jgi:hypothetical protein